MTSTWRTAAGAGTATVFLWLASPVLASPFYSLPMSTAGPTASLALQFETGMDPQTNVGRPDFTFGHVRWSQRLGTRASFAMTLGFPRNVVYGDSAADREVPMAFQDTFLDYRIARWWQWRVGQARIPFGEAGNTPWEERPTARPSRIVAELHPGLSPGVAAGGALGPLQYVVRAFDDSSRNDRTPHGWRVALAVEERFRLGVSRWLSFASAGKYLDESRIVHEGVDILMVSEPIGLSAEFARRTWDVREWSRAATRYVEIARLREGLNVDFWITMSRKSRFTIRYDHILNPVATYGFVRSQIDFSSIQDPQVEVCVRDLLPGLSAFVTYSRRVADLDFIHPLSEIRTTFRYVFQASMGSRHAEEQP